MSNLQASIRELSETFALRIVEALRSASLDDLMALAHGNGRASAVRARGPGARAVAQVPRGRIRRSASDLQSTLDKIVSLVAKHEEGLRAEVIRTQLGLHKSDVPRPLALGLESGVLSKKGEKRATTYFATGAEPKAVEKAPKAKKTASTKRRAGKKAPKK